MVLSSREIEMGLNVFVLLAIGAWGAITALLGLLALGWYRQLVDAKKELGLFRQFLGNPLIAQFTKDQMEQLRVFIRDAVQASWTNISDKVH